MPVVVELVAHEREGPGDRPASVAGHFKFNRTMENVSLTVEAWGLPPARVVGWVVNFELEDRGELEVAALRAAGANSTLHILHVFHSAAAVPVVTNLKVMHWRPGSTAAQVFEGEPEGLEALRCPRDTRHAAWGGHATGSGSDNT